MNEILYVMENNKNVSINEENLKKLIQQLEINKYEHWSDNNETIKALNDKEKILFAFMLESCNFCFWPNYNWKVEYKGKEYTGSDALLYSFIKAVENKIISLDSQYLKNVDREIFNVIFKSNETYPIMMNERYNSFKSSMEFIGNNENDFFKKIVGFTSVKDLEKYISSNINSFNDQCEYKGKTIHFNKRCRLLISDLYYLNNDIKNNIKDIEKLLGCADYSIPRYLNECEIFVYSKQLEEKIKNGVELDYGSEEEVEIRAATLYILEKIKEILNKKNINLTTIEIDNIVWKMSRVEHIKLSHHTKSIYY